MNRNTRIDACNAKGITTARIARHAGIGASRIYYNSATPEEWAKVDAVLDDIDAGKILPRQSRATASAA
jgi:hypothetical protein